MAGAKISIDLIQNHLEYQLLGMQTSLNTEQSEIRTLFLLKIDGTFAIKKFMYTKILILHNQISAQLSLLEDFMYLGMQPAAIASKMTFMEKQFSDIDDSFEKAKRSEKAFEIMRREQAAQARNTEEKLAEEKKHLAEMKRKKAKILQQQQEALLATINGLKGQPRALFDLLFSKFGLHDKIESSEFSKMIAHLPPFNMKQTELGALLYFEDTPLTGLHSEHNGKKMNGAVIRAFLAKLTDLGITPDTLPTLKKERPKGVKT